MLKIYLNFSNENMRKLRKILILRFFVEWSRGRILVQVTIYRRLLIDRDVHLDQSEAYDIS